MDIKILVEIVVDHIDADLLKVKNNLRNPQILANKIAERFLGKKPNGYHTDHIDNDWRNNRRSNLQYLPAQDNMRKGSKNPRSKFTGIHWVNVERGSYIGARIKHNGKYKYLGYFETEEQAAKAYDDYVIANGLDRKLNFPT